MEKAITLKGNGQAPVQRYMDDVIKKYILTSKYDPTLILTHRFKFDDMPAAYKAFDEKRIDQKRSVPFIKCFVETKHSKPRALGPELGPVPH